MLAQLNSRCWLPVLMHDSLRCNSASMTPRCANLHRQCRRHADPLLVHNGEVTEVNVGGMPLGWLPEAEYDEGP